MRLARWADAVLAAAAVTLLAAAAPGLLRGEASGMLGTVGVVLRGALVVLGIGLLAALRLSSSARANLATALLSSVIALYAAQGAIGLIPEPNVVRDAARRARKSFDARPKIQVVRDLRASGTPAVPAMDSELQYRFGDIVPLGGISRRTTVLCNESGPWELFESDEHGFNNPRGLWTGEPPLIVAVGDSYIQGYCVPRDSSIVGRIRRELPGTLSLGVAATGPLGQLAVVREYLPALRTPTVLWFYFENDLSDLAREMRRPALARYLTDGYSQGLAARQTLVDSTLAARLAAEESSFVAEERTAKASRGGGVRYFLTLGPLRGLAGQLLGAGARRAERVEVHDPAAYRDVLAKGKATVEGWGGSIWLVYLPSSRRYDPSAPGKINERQIALRDTVLATARGLGLRVIDLDPAFRATGDPLSLFAYSGGHYNERGHALVADALIRDLLAGGRR